MSVTPQPTTVATVPPAVSAASAGVASRTVVGAEAGCARCRIATSEVLAAELQSGSRRDGAHVDPLAGADVEHALVQHDVDVRGVGRCDAVRGRQHGVGSDQRAAAELAARGGDAGPDERDDERELAVRRRHPADHARRGRARRRHGAEREQQHGHDGVGTAPHDATIVASTGRARLPTTSATSTCTV